MMKSILLAAFMISAFTALQAQKCKWDVEEKDRFTGSMHLVAKKELVNEDKHKAGQAQSYATVVLEYKENQILFNAKHHIGGPALGVDRIAKPTLSLQPSKGEVITIQSDESFPTQLFIGATEVDFQFVLSKGQLETLAGGLEAFRISFDGANHDFTPSSKEKEKFAGQFACMREALSE